MIKVFLSCKNLPVVWSQNTSHDFALLLPTVSENTFNINTAYLWLSLQTQCRLVRANERQKGVALFRRLLGKIMLWRRLLINSSWYDKLTIKHENGYIETKFSTNIQALDKEKKTLLSYSKKKKLIHVIYIYTYTKTNSGLQKTCEAESPYKPTYRQWMSVSVP